MNRSTAKLAPTPAFRRLVLGTAFLAGLAFALVPRTPAAQAQQTPPPAAESRQPSAPTSVTITNGRGVEAKIEVKESAEPKAGTATGAGGQAEAAPPPDAGKGTSRGHNVAIGKHGRVTVNGLGTDREFDSFGEFVHDEPAIAAMVVAIVAVVFLAPVLAIGLILWYRMRKARMLNETMLKLAERGVVAPADALQALTSGKQAAILSAAASTAPLYEQAKQIRRRAAWSDLRKGVFTGGVGLALSLYSMLEDREPNAIGLVLLFVGIGFVVLWWFEERQLAPSVGGASGGTSGGPPPSA